MPGTGRRRQGCLKPWRSVFWALHRLRPTCLPTHPTGRASRSRSRQLPAWPGPRLAAPRALCPAGSPVPALLLPETPSRPGTEAPQARGQNVGIERDLEGPHPPSRAAEGLGTGGHWWARPWRVQGGGAARLGRARGRDLRAHGGTSSCPHLGWSVPQPGGERALPHRQAAGLSSDLSPGSGQGGAVGAAPGDGTSVTAQRRAREPAGGRWPAGDLRA